LPELKGEFEDYGLTQRKALIRYYFKEDPKNAEEFCRLWGQLHFALLFDGKVKVKTVVKG